MFVDTLGEVKKTNKQSKMRKAPGNDGVSNPGARILLEESYSSFDQRHQCHAISFLGLSKVSYLKSQFYLNKLQILTLQRNNSSKLTVLFI